MYSISELQDYENAKKKFRIEVPENFNFGFDVVDKHAKDRNRLAMVWTDPAGKEVKKYTFWDFSRYSNKAVNALKKIGIKKGDRVFLMLPRIPEWYGIIVGCHKLGAVVIPSPGLLTPADIEYRLVKSKANVIITNVSNYLKVEEECKKTEFPSLKHKILLDGEVEGWRNFESMVENASPKLNRKELEQTKSSDPFLIYFTSGTTKYPKMVLHRCTYPLGHVRTAGLWHDAHPSDLIWVLSDTGWAKAAWGFYGQWVLGTGLFIHNAEGRFNPKLTMKLMQEHGITIFCAPPTVYRMLILEDLSVYDFSNLRVSTSAGEPLNPEVIKAWRDASGLTIREAYGQTETTMLVGNYRFLPVKPGSMGKPSPDLQVEILDDNNMPLTSGEAGYIALRVAPEKPVGIFDEYLDELEENSRVFKDGWYFTGDKAYKDHDGYLYFFGRADDVIKASGYRIGPFEVESVLQEHPAVAESAVVGSPDDIRGEIVKAFIILAPGYKPSDDLMHDIQEYVKKNTAPYKYPREVEFVEELPKTTSGKIKRAVLRKMEFDRKIGRNFDGIEK
ncbi:MAG: AMP-binding protein [Dissulfurispiraceae bacterium]|jgi:acetyl-CoA synthetase|nr:AMP-binding protein [Dissulfurispiraceae bacterium]